MLNFPSRTVAQSKLFMASRGYVLKELQRLTNGQRLYVFTHPNRPGCELNLLTCELRVAHATRRCYLWPELR